MVSFAHHLLKTVSHCIFLPSLPKINRSCVGLFLGSLFCPIDPHVSFCVNIMMFTLL
uniref:Uncharacterized protein n=1 Tax=Sus scrofa TaxID=9823 RepID=A0A8D1CSS3_PIG